jgi:hypothetical protein
MPYPRCFGSSGPVTAGGPVRSPLGRTVGAPASRNVGITGGKQLVVLVGQKKALAMAVKNHLGRRRYTKLAEWLS